MASSSQQSRSQQQPRPQSSASPANRQADCLVDPLDLLDFSDYDNTNNNMTFPSSSDSSDPPVFSGPSHQYDQYKQQTPFVPGAIASTMALNASNPHMSGYTLDYGVSSSTQLGTEDVFDFNSAAQSHTSPDMDMDFDSSPEAPFFFGDSIKVEPTVNPSSTINDNSQNQTMSPPPPPMASNVGRMYPGMHQRAALAAKAQAQQRQQQQIIQQQQMMQQQQQQRQQQQRQPQPHHKPKQKSVSQLPNPIVEQKISQLLSDMRAKSNMDDFGNQAVINISRPKKEEDDMDEDERLLASEEGKRLSSKERRQLRNKVSARAFRSRRKEYIGQLESEIASKVTENSELRSQNMALMEENRRLSDLTRMLLSSASFSNFLDQLSTNPNPNPVPQVNQNAQHQQHQQQQLMEHRQAQGAKELSSLNQGQYRPRAISVNGCSDQFVVGQQQFLG